MIGMSAYWLTYKPLSPSSPRGWPAAEMSKLVRRFESDPASATTLKGFCHGPVPDDRIWVHKKRSDSVSAFGALLQYRTYGERQQKNGYDPFGKPMMNDRCLAHSRRPQLSRSDQIFGAQAAFQPPTPRPAPLLTGLPSPRPLAQAPRQRSSPSPIALGLGQCARPNSPSLRSRGPGVNARCKSKAGRSAR